VIWKSGDGEHLVIGRSETLTPALLDFDGWGMALSERSEISWVTLGVEALGEIG
jgi:hypothetical protein